jgi:hypothetical protein
MCAKRETHRLKSEIGTTSLVRDWESVSSDTELAALYASETNTAGAQNDNTAIATTMCPQESNVRVTCEDHILKRMGNVHKRFTGSLTVNSGQSHSCYYMTKGTRHKTGIDCCRLTRRTHRLHRSIGADPRCGGASGTLT